MARRHAGEGTRARTRIALTEMTSAQRLAATSAGVFGVLAVMAAILLGVLAGVVVAVAAIVMASLVPE